MIKEHKSLWSIVLILLFIIICLFLVAYTLGGFARPPATITNTTEVGRMLWGLHFEASIYRNNHNTYGNFSYANCSIIPHSPGGSFLDDTSSTTISAILRTPGITASSTRCFVHEDLFAVAAIIPETGNWWCIDSNSQNSEPTNIGSSSSEIFSTTQLCRE